jgi:Asp-tRNA(Asn)/Glu-tRNA(Gln) amidotransferase A subunit family amidase
VSTVDVDLAYLSATEAIARFKDRSLSPVELLDAVIARSEQVDPQTHSYTYTFYDQARDQARGAEAAYANDQAARPLEGIPVAIKDFHALKGEITTYGSRMFEGARSEYTVPTVERLLGAGAIMHARTRTPEFAHCGHCHSPLWGATRNPWNLAYSPGGSSGGASSAVAAGMTCLAEGTDAGGSVRIPASASGVFGYKPPFGRLPLERDHPFEMMLSYGPITRTVADAAVMQNVMAGTHPMDITSLPPLTIPRDLQGIDGWRVAFSMDLGYFEIDSEVQQNTRDAIRAFEELGATVEEVDVGWNSGALDAWETYFEGLFAGLMGDALPRWRYEMDPYLVGIIDRGMGHSAHRMYRTYLVRAEMWRALAPILDDYQILICPTLAVPSVDAEHDNGDTGFTVNGKPVQAHLGWALTYPFNLLNQLPVASVPSGFAPSNGVPTGLQIIGRPFDDVGVFRAASAFESARPWRDRHPAI